MRVLQVVGSFDPERCGVAHYALRLAQALQACGVESRICSLESNANCSVPVLPLGSSEWSLRALFDLLNVARDWQADWIHLQYAPASFDHRRVVGLLPLLRRLVPRAPRVVTTIHEFGGWPLRSPRLLDPLARRIFLATERAGWFDRETLTLFGMSDRTVVTNSAHLKAVQDCSPRLAKRTRVIPVGPNVGPDVAPEPTRALARARLGVEDHRFVAIFFGFVHPVKGIETLLRAMQQVHQANPTALLWIVGGVESLALRGDEARSYEREVRRTIADLGLAGVVDLTGFLPDAAAARRLRAADLAVLPFNHGVTLKSGSLMTCLSYGLPVVATSGGDRSGLRNVGSVWPVPPRDPETLSSAMHRLAGDEGLRRRLGAASAPLARDFSWPEIARRHLEIYAATE